MNLVALERIIDRFGRRYFKTEIFEGEAGSRGARGEKGADGIGVSGAILGDSGLVFSMSDNSTVNVGKIAPKALKIANLGNLNGKNTTIFVKPFSNPKFLAINGILYHDSEYVIEDGVLTTTFDGDDIPTGNLKLIYKEANE